MHINENLLQRTTRKPGQKIISAYEFLIPHNADNSFKKNISNIKILSLNAYLADDFGTEVENEPETEKKNRSYNKYSWES